METRNSDFTTVMREILQQRTGEAATYTHIECKTGGLERAAMGMRVLTDWLKDHHQGSATYMFVNKVDHRTALDNTEIEEEVVTTDGAGQGKLFATTYSRWVRQAIEAADNQGKLVFVMDMGFGVRTGDMALAAMTMLHNLQGLLRGDKSGTTVLWVSVSYSDEALLCDKSGRLVGGLLLPRFNEPRICNQDKAHEKADGPQRPDKDWQSAAAGQILQEVIKDATLPMAIALVMSIEDAYLVINELSASPQCPPHTLHLIHPWTDQRAAREAVASSKGLKIVYIDPEVSVVGAIHYLKAVVVAPALNAFDFDVNTTSIVKKTVVCDLTAALASSIQGAGLQGADVRMVKGFSHPVPAPNPRIFRRVEPAELSPASDRDFWYLNLASHAVSGGYAFPGLLSVVVPPMILKLDEAVRRLDLWHLVDRTDLPPGVDPRSRVPSPLADPVAQYVRVESNIHSLVLMAHAKRDLPMRVKHVLIDLAMLISQGPLSVFDHTGTVKSEREHRRIIQGLGQQAGFAKKHCHKGLLWQAIAYLNCFRQLMADSTWGPEEWAASKLGGVVRYDVLARLSERISWCKRAFNVPTEDHSARLAGEEFEAVEAMLVSAFPFNLMMVHAEDVGYFGHDVTSQVILEEEAQGETVHWKGLTEKARNNRDGAVRAIYSHLWMDIEDDDLRVYRAIGVTAISAEAFKEGLEYLEIDHFSSLRPVIRPDRRCLVRRGESWSSNQVDSSSSVGPV